MQYLKNALSSIGHRLHDSALHAFQGPHRWWKLAFFAAMFVLPGGSVVIALAAWLDHRRHQRGLAAASTPHAAKALRTVAQRAAHAHAPLRP